MRNGGERSLKSLNMKWLVLLAISDILIVMLYIVPDTITNSTLTQLGIGRVLATTLTPVLVLLFVNAVPHDIKSMLVYWRPRGVLPGSEAFTKHGPADPRIDMSALKNNVGALPTDPAAQNSMWYQLYKQVASETEVSDAHKLFLMYRDMAVMSLPMIVLVPVFINSTTTSPEALWLAAGLFLIQYALTALSARWSGIRFVCNVLAVHSASRIVPPKPVRAQ